MWKRPVRLPLLGDRVERDGFLEGVFTTWYGYTPMGMTQGLSSLALAALNGDGFAQGHLVGASVGLLLPVKANGGLGLGNPFKNSSLSQIELGFQRHLASGKLQLKFTNPITGAKSYLNTKSGYSYNLDPGGMYGKKLEGPHIDVNYPHPKPKGSPKKKLPVLSGF